MKSNLISFFIVTGILLGSIALTMVVGYQLSYGNRWQGFDKATPYEQLVMLTNGFYGEEGKQRAIKLLDKLIAANPNKAELYYMRGRTRLQEPTDLFPSFNTDTDEVTEDLARNDFSKAIALSPGFANAYMARARIESDAGKRIADLKQVTQEVPSCITAWTYLGRAYSEEQDEATASMCFDRAKKLHSGAAQIDYEPDSEPNYEPDSEPDSEPDYHSRNKSL